MEIKSIKNKIKFCEIVSNKFILEGYNEDVAIRLTSIVLSQRRVYRFKGIRTLLNSIEREERRKENRIMSNNTPQKLYEKEVRRLTEINSHKVKGIEKRGFKNYHLDHILPIWLGFKYGVDKNKMASVENLRMIPYRENMSKGIKLTEEGKKLLIKFTK